MKKFPGFARTKQRPSLLAALGGAFTLVALGVTALILASGLHDALNGPAWLTWGAGVGAALALDAVWTAGLTKLGTGLKVRGGLLALSVAMVAAGLGGSVACVLAFGHHLLLAAPAVVGMALLVADAASGYLTPSADVVARIDRQRREEQDAATLAAAAKRLVASADRRAADERDAAYARDVAEAVGVQRYAVGQRAAVIAAKAGLYAELSAAVDAHQADADKLDALLDGRPVATAPAIAPTTAPAAPRIDATSEKATAPAIAPAAPNLRPNRPALDDEALLKVGRDVWKSLPEPVSQAAFIKAYRAAGHKGSWERLAALYKTLAAEAGQVA